MFKACRIASRCRSLRGTRSLSSWGSEKFGMGSHKWTQMEEVNYLAVVKEALKNQITLFEAGQEGGDAWLKTAYHRAISQVPDLASHKVKILQRVGYRSILPSSVKKDDKEQEQTGAITGDVSVEEHAVENSQDKVRVVHNIGKEYIRKFLNDSAITSLKTEFSHAIDLIPMIHNPETQASTLQSNSADERQFRLRERLVESFLAMEQEVDNGAIASYGIVSNGLCLPSDHPLHLSLSDTVSVAVNEAKEKLGKDLNLSVLQFPINLLETSGLDLAKQIKSDKDLDGVQVYAMRPLTCYPDRGTGSGQPFIIADYKLPASLNDSKMTWSHKMEGPPEAYQVALKTAMAHFDAEEILQAKQEGQELTAEQRETLDGCKLLQSLLHDVDVGLDKMRSFSAHQEQLYEKIIPLIHDTFEGYDEETSNILQSFFSAYSLAVRYSIAKNTRHLLKKGEGVKGVPTYPDIPDDMPLQEFGLRFLLKEQTIDKLILGWSSTEQVHEDLEIAERFFSEQPSQQ